MDIRVFYPNYNKTIQINGITCNSRDVKRNDIFVAIKGYNNDGLEFINEAIANGATIIIAQHSIPYPINSIIVADTKVEYIRLLQIYYNYNPLDHYITGVTGTDGKTTTSIILHHIMNGENHSSYIGTNGIYYLNKKIATKNTTINPHLLYENLEEFINNDIRHTVMEVSSEGILDKRVSNLFFNGAIFTNLSHEHLNTHKTMKSYFLTKASLFSSLSKKSLAVLNYDDKYGRKLKRYTKAKIASYGIKNGDYKAKNIYIYADKIKYDFYYKKMFLDTITIFLFGTYNVYNSLAAIVYAYEYGIPLNIIKSRLLSLDKIDGRFEQFSYNSNTFIIDFAHTPRALDSLLSNLNLLPHNKIILVLGCAGEKDKSKRHIMGEIATKKADTVIFTSEDPKNEKLVDILYDLTKSAKGNYYLCFSRKDAIKLAVTNASKNDFIIVTGKGNEMYENIKGQLYRHNDLQEIKKSLGI